MKLYQITIIIIAILVFVGTFILCISQYSPTQQKFPPSMTNCPDYWTINQNGTCNIEHKNIGTLQNHRIYKYTINGEEMHSHLSSFYDKNTDQVVNGTILTDKNRSPILGYYNSDIPGGYDENNPQNAVIDFNSNEWSTNGSKICAIKSWAMEHNIHWDGMMNYDTC